ncbi:MAG: mandelate racemase/muconate lactonizing enzyme family protein [Pseudomonadota bacterium]
MSRSSRIEHVESIVAGNAHFVRIRTEAGLEGVGQSACWAYPNAVDAIVAALVPTLRGQDAGRIEHIWQSLYRIGPFRGSVLGGAISAIDIALWDIKGRSLGVPIWDLLGGNCRERIRLHLLILDDLEPGELATTARKAVDDGFTAIKFDPIPNDGGLLGLNALVNAVKERVSAAREAVGPEVDIIVELHRKLTPLQAMPVLAAIAPFQVLASEDPIQIDSIQSQAELSRRMPQPMANGERLNTIWEFKELLAQGGAQFVRPDLGLAGGISHVKKIAAIAESHHVAVMPHNFLGPVLTAASLHIDAAIPNFVTQEYPLTDETDWVHAVSGLPKRDGGFLPLPEGPGLGVELADLEALARVSSPGLPSGVALRADGSVAGSV